MNTVDTYMHKHAHIICNGRFLRSRTIPFPCCGHDFELGEWESTRVRTDFQSSSCGFFTFWSARQCRDVPCRSNRGTVGTVAGLCTRLCMDFQHQFGQLHRPLWRLRGSHLWSPRLRMKRDFPGLARRSCASIPWNSV